MTVDPTATTAFAAIYDAEFVRIRNWLITSTHCDFHTAEDITQAAFLSAWQHWTEFEERGFGKSAWLHRIAKRKWIDWSRRKARGDMPSGWDHAQAGEDEAQIVDRLDAVALLRQLRPKDRRELLAAALGYTDAEMATGPGNGASTVRVKRFRARAALAALAAL